MHSDNTNAQEQPQMTVIGHRPTTVARVSQAQGLYVLCRLANGEDVYVPLTDIFALFEQEMAAKLRRAGS